MYCKIDDFINDWKAEEEFTLKIFSTIDDEYLSYKTSDNTRSLGRLAWHLTQTLTEMNHKAGLLKEDSLDGKPIPETMKEIMDTYKKYSGDLTDAVKESWKDEELTQSVEMYGQAFEKRLILSMLVKHQIHHRGQMTILMRLQGLKVPGIYGPAQEEWSNYGMEPQE